MTAYAFAAAMAALGVNGPEDQRFEGDVDEWETIDWRPCEKQVQRIRQRIFKATWETSRRRRCGLLEPCAATSCTHGSEGPRRSNAPGLPGDTDFGPAFIKVCTYCPWPIKIWVNGHEWVKRQAAQTGIGFTELSNGFAATDDPAALQAICDRLGPGTINVFFQRWLARLPLPLTPADRDAGYWWELSMAQVEVSRTLVLTQPRYARGFFEALVADNLDLGRPDTIEIVFDRQIRGGKRATGGEFKTKVVPRPADRDRRQRPQRPRLSTPTAQP